ncbi:MAG: NAD(P)H-dependent oxidoreductase [Propionibacteriaceae bacterium]|nr:NAD(P)H-dependent oxidoreductase [Propionibacteriaceae bacterium]
MESQKTTKTIGLVVGSLRRDSFCKKVATYVGDALADQFDVTVVDISDLPLYNEDLDHDGCVPPQWARLRHDVGALDAVIFVTPEYNRSMPAVIKNAMDVASRPYGANVWSGKPGAVISVSPGAIGGFGANHHLRQVASFLNIYMMQQPEAYIGGIAGAVDANGVTDERVQDFLQQIAKAFTDWVNQLDGALS